MITRAAVQGRTSAVSTSPARRRTPRTVASVAAAALATATVVTVALLVPGDRTPQLEIHDHSGDTVTRVRSVEVGETFALVHTHSVTGRPVVETFSVLDAETVAIESLVFDEHGPNLPAGPAHVGEHATYTTDGRVVRVDHHGHPIGSLPLVIGSDGVNHRVIFSDGQRLRLLDVAERGSRVEIVVAPPQGEGAAG